MQQKDRSAVDDDDDIPLPDAAWRRELADLALACAGSFPGEEPLRIRAIRELLARVPDPGLRAGLTVPSAERVESLIAAEAGECAVLALFGGEAGYLLSRGAGGQHLASVILPDSSEEVTAGGDSLILALISALALALAEVTPGAAMVAEARSRDGLRLN